MGSPANPPWMSELVAKNHKIVRNMWQSTDARINGDTKREEGHANESDLMSTTTSSSAKPVGNTKKQVVEPKSTSINTTTLISNKGGTTMAAVVQEQMHRTTNVRNSGAEKSSPIRDGGSFMNGVDSPKSMKYSRNEHEESILEYGPGIVKKLRSRYQSLALRQFNIRPSLRRSASLENVLDLDGSGEGIKRESPSPTLFDDENYCYKANDKKPDKEITIAGMTKSKSTSAVVDQTSNGHQIYEKKPPGSRGRAAVSERRDRMRRARSVDALQRTKHEEEILEKFKAVVLPKEEIVIIEVSKPRANLNGLGLSNNSAAYYLATPADKNYPTQLFISPDHTTAGLTVSDHQQGGVRSRSFVSPEHELPPHDIVKETARIFEKNQENYKRVGQALRLSKSPSTSSFTPPPSPGGMNMSQGTGVARQTDKAVPTNFKIGNAKPTVLGLKQVGIIRPTVNQAPSALNTKEEKGVKLDIRPPAISPLASPTQQPYKSFLQQNSQKPPLSPKPLFTSSPKPSTTNNFVKSPSLESPLTVPTFVNQSSNNFENNANNKSETFSERINENISIIKDVRSPVGVRKNLKHVPNSFTISTESKEITPVLAPTSQQKSSSPQVNGVNSSSKVKSQPIHNTLPNFSEPESVKTVTAKITETPQVSHINKPNEIIRKISSPQPQRKPPVPTTSPPPPPPRKVVEESNSTSQLRVHQKQKSNQSGNSAVVFNFTSRSKVPDYIEDDGLHKGKMTLAGTVTDESVDDVDSTNYLNVEVDFVGANVIINGKSSIQKRPKSTKLNISFNEDAITTYEYPSETSLIVDEEMGEKDMLGHKGPSVINNSGSGLGSYTPKAKNDYQLGSFDAPTKKADVIKKGNENELIEDYLKPDSENTTWSNEIGADILF